MSPPVVTGAAATTGLNAVTQKDAEVVIEQEVKSFTEHIENLLSDRTHLSPKYLPISDFFEAFRDGVLLAELVNVIKPGLIDTRALKPIDFGRYEEGMKRMASAAQVSTVDTDLSKTMFEVTNNLNQAINAAKKVGIVVVNIGANDFLERKQDLILGIVWQLIRYHLLSAVNLNSHPELVRLLQPNETMSTLLGLPAEATLLRWFNYHLQRAGVQRTIKNFSKDVQDCELYIKLLSQIAPPKHKEEIDILLARATSFSGETEPGRLGRAQLVLEAAALLGARKFATAKDIVQGNAKLNLGFTATLFNREIGINLPSEDEMRQQKTLIQRQADSIDELQKVVEQKDNTITQLGLMIRGKDERILELNEKVRETTLARLEEKDDLEKKSLDAKAELAAYKKKVAFEFTALREALKERDPDVLMEVADSTVKTAAVIGSMLQELKDQRALIEKLQTKIERDEQINKLIETKVKEYAEQKTPAKTWLASKKSSQ